MALNKFMHPRNPYKDKKPDFKALASKYEEFRKHTTQDSKEHVHIDFKKPECMRALSWALLKEDFGLDVEMPLNRLIPTVPLRLNYILWIEDLLANKHDGVKGIDIGTGASCVYPLLAAKMNSWKFLATETDDFSTEYAKRNVARNGLQEVVQVLQVSPSTKLCGVINEGDMYDFCMCNPPFFGSNLEAWGMLTSRSDDRPEPKSVSTASPQESIVVGGEVEFVKQIILDSLKLRNQIRIYTSMLGKKSSLAALKSELHKHGISTFGTTELCQGRTMRWALGWTFDKDVIFKAPISKSSRQKPRLPLLVKLPCQCRVSDRVGDMSITVIQLLKLLQMTYKDIDTAASSRKWQVTAEHNTWSHQRRKRRQMAQLTSNEKLHRPDRQSDCVAVCNARTEQNEITSNSIGIHHTLRTADPKVCKSGDRLTADITVNGDICTGERTNGNATPHRGMGNDMVKTEKGEEGKGFGQADEGEESEHLLTFLLSVTQEQDDVVLQFTWVDGCSYDFLHQVVQFFKNRLAT